MSKTAQEPTVGAPWRTRRMMYVVAVIVLVLMCVIGLLTFASARSTANAQAKADQLLNQLNQAGLRTPSKDQIVRVLGDDGGAVCANPNDALNRAALAGQLVNGAGGPGTRPVIADTHVVQGQQLILGVYCPEELPEFTAYAEELKTADVAKE